MFWLLRYPKYLTRLWAEADGLMEDSELIVPYSKVRNLSYLQACLDESLPITPPFSFNLSRVTPKEGFVIMSELL